MKKFGFYLLMMLVLFLAACSSSSDDAEATGSPVEPALEQAPEGVPDAEEDIIPRVTITPTAVSNDSADGAYPAIEYPTATPYPEGYPLPEAIVPQSPYPIDGETIMVLKPAGEQCADSLNYETEKDAQASLEAAGIETSMVKTVNLNVLSACGGATSTQYLVEISAKDAANAEALGWTILSIDDLKEIEGN